MRTFSVAAVLGLAVTGLVGCGAANPSTAAPVTPTAVSATATATPEGTELSVSGAFSGTLTNTATKCGQIEALNGLAQPHFLEATGSLNEHSFDVRVFDPNGPPDYESQSYIVIIADAKTESPPYSQGLAWLSPAESREVIVDYDPLHGATVDAIAQSVGGPGQWGYNPNGPLKISGRVAC